MKKPYQKTAKDLAWDRERTRLQSEITKLRKRLYLTMKELADDNAMIEAQKMRITELEADVEKTRGLLDLPREYLNLLLAKTRKREEAELIIQAMFSVGMSYGGGKEIE